MGQIILCKCSDNSCGYEKELFCGVGMGVRKASIIEKCVSESVFADFTAKRQEGRVIEFRLENKAALCEKCRELFSASAFTYKLSDGSVTEYIAPCSECGGTVLTFDDTADIACPKCGGKTAVTSAGHWD